VWWRQLIFPRGKVRRIFLLDSLLVTAFFVVQVAAYAIAAQSTGQSPLALIALGVAVPFVLWLYMAGIVFFLHHTDHDARWHAREADWREEQPDVGAAHCTTLPLGLHRLLHSALDHAVHHIDPTVPSYRTRRATRALAARFPDEVARRHITPARYVRIARSCQLYDYTRHAWTSIAAVERSRTRQAAVAAGAQHKAARHA
jgi:omega-6 fatty acid desaturase (delta-12 desaturase)